MRSTNDSQPEMIHGAEAAVLLEPNKNAYNVSQNDLFFFLKEEDKSLYISDKSLENVLQLLEKNSMFALR